MGGNDAGDYSSKVRLGGGSTEAVATREKGSDVG